MFCLEAPWLFDGKLTWFLALLPESNHRLARLVNTNRVCLQTTHHITVCVEEKEQTNIACCLLGLLSWDVT